MKRKIEKPSDKENALWSAADTNDIAKLNSLLNKKINIDYIKDEVTPLWIAANNGYYEMCKILVNAGANVNYNHPLGQTVLWTAAENGFTQIVRLLLENGVLKDEICHKATALFVAVQNQHLDTVNELLNAGCEVNIPQQGTLQTPLFGAVRSGNFEIVTALIKSDANVNLACSKGFTPAHVAALKGYINIIDLLLLAKANVNLFNRVGHTALSLARHSNNELIAQKILESAYTLTDYSFSWLSKQFKTYLDIMGNIFPKKYKKDDIDKIKLQLDAGLCYGFSLLLAATEEEQWEDLYSRLKLISLWDRSKEELEKNKQLSMIIEEILGDLMWFHTGKYILSPEQEITGSTLINFVVKKELKKEIIFNFGFLLRPIEIQHILTLIVQPGKRVEIGCLNSKPHSLLIIKNKLGEYILIDVNSSIGPIKESSIENVVSTLCLMFFQTEEQDGLYGLNFTVFDSLNSSDKVKYQERKSLITKSLLDERKESGTLNISDTDGVTSLACAVYANDEDTVLKLLEIDGVGIINNKAIVQSVFLAAQMGNLTILKGFKSLGVDLDRNYNGQSPLFISASLGRIDVTKFLILQNAEVNQKDDTNGVTPLMISAQNGHLACVVALVEGGADINQLSQDKRSPLAFACLNRHANIVDYLAVNGADTDIDLSGFKLIDYAIVAGHLNIVEILVYHGAKLNSKNSLGKTPLEMAHSTSQMHIAEFIQHHLPKMQIGPAKLSFFNETNVDSNKIKSDLKHEPNEKIYSNL
ncbi:MAG: ankyrin repeat domain-containing protein [Legionella sp.]|jgi:ankyrin repeat protein